MKTGTRISDARVLSPGIAIVESKPPEYIRYPTDSNDYVGFRPARSSVP